MIQKIVAAVILILIGAGLMYAGLSRHIIRTADQTLVLPKTSLALQDSYVDIRKWTVDDFTEHPEVTKALVDHGHGDLVRTAGVKDVIEKVKDIFGASEAE